VRVASGGAGQRSAQSFGQQRLKVAHRVSARAVDGAAGRFLRFFALVMALRAAASFSFARFSFSFAALSLRTRLCICFFFQALIAFVARLSPSAFAFSASSDSRRCLWESTSWRVRCCRRTASARPTVEEVAALAALAGWLADGDGDGADKASRKAATWALCNASSAAAIACSSFVKRAGACLFCRTHLCRGGGKWCASLM